MFYLGNFWDKSPSWFLNILKILFGQFQIFQLLLFFVTAIKIYTITKFAN